MLAQKKKKKKKRQKKKQNKKKTHTHTHPYTIWMIGPSLKYNEFILSLTILSQKRSFAELTERVATVNNILKTQIFEINLQHI